MELIKVIKALNSDRRMKILQLLSNRPLSSIQTYQKYHEKYDDGVRRETIYRDLEQLTDCGLLNKKYSKKEKEIKYELKYNEIKIDLEEGDIKMIK